MMKNYKKSASQTQSDASQMQKQRDPSVWLTEEELAALRKDQKEAAELARKLLGIKK